VHQDIQSFADKSLVKSNEQYDLIICNPPFFSQHSPTSSDSSLRHIARHTDCLTYKDLCASIAKLLTKEGVAYLLLPVAIKQKIILSFADVGLCVVEITEISESEHHTAKVMIIKASFCMNEDMCISNTLNKFSSNDCHTEQAKQYLSSFLLRYKNTI
jgi:tRNA1Val (adenine37-N6)-methyltransferase